jgi:hypothetical protein
MRQNIVSFLTFEFKTTKQLNAMKNHCMVSAPLLNSKDRLGAILLCISFPIMGCIFGFWNETSKFLYDKPHLETKTNWLVFTFCAFGMAVSGIFWFWIIVVCCCGSGSGTGSGER